MNETKKNETRVDEPLDAKRARSRAFTLLEMLVVLVLIVIVLGGVSALIRVFSRSYESDERRVGRAQLARSISRMLDEDLGSAVQDPIQAVADDSTRQFIRHFGLRGDERSLQIDVVQPSLFAPSATNAENQRALQGGDKSPNSRQVPELKTIFYEFVPINAREGAADDAGDDAVSSSEGEDLGSTLSGSLLTDSDSSLSATSLDPSSLLRESQLVDMRPYAQKFGLSRRELDYETPEDDEDAAANASSGVNIDPTTGMVASSLSGSLTSPPDASESTLAGSSLGNSGLGLYESGEATYKEPLTATQIAMDADDGTTWAPEVLDCRFRYFDGENWIDSWDSIEKKGLPIAIKVELKLAPLDDVDLYRNSPLLAMLPEPLPLETLSKLAQQTKSSASTEEGASRLSGSLLKTADETSGQPIDVFNSYRPIESTRAALEGVRLSSKNASAYAEIAYSSALTQAVDAEANLEDPFDEEETLPQSALAGALTETNESSSALGGSLETQGEEDDALRAVQEMVANGAVFNEMGVCVDFSNDGSYVTLEQIATELGLAEPIVYEVVVYLPTTPLSRATSAERRKPTLVRQGAVVARNANANSSRARRAQGNNPYATGRARQARERTLNERSVNERTARDRNAGDRRAAERQTATRGANNRQAAERGARAERQVADRGSRERNVNGRQARERNVDVFVDDSEQVGERGASRAAVEARVTPQTPEPVARPNETNNARGGALAGGLNGSTGATTIGGVDPFAIVNEQLETVPFASSDASFDAIGLPTTQGLIETPNGQPTVASPTSTPQTAQGQRQTWIRGKR